MGIWSVCVNVSVSKDLLCLQSLPTQTFHLKRAIAESLPSLPLNLLPLCPSISASSQKVAFSFLFWNKRSKLPASVFILNLKKMLSPPSFHLLILQLICTANECYLAWDIMGDLVYLQHRGWKETMNKDDERANRRDILSVAVHSDPHRHKLSKQWHLLKIPHCLRNAHI